MAQDTHQQAVERFDAASEAMSEQHERMREDLRFSNPSRPEQWDDDAVALRKGRPCLTFDRTNQFISQVVNSGRQNKPAIHCLPADSDADVEVAEKLNGIVRHIEYVSRAGIAYDTALESAARIGLGWIRIANEVMRPESGEQEIRIKRIVDPLAVLLEAGWEEPDGSDAKHGFVESRVPLALFKKQYPKADTTDWESDRQDTGWVNEKSIRFCEYFHIEETKETRLAISLDGQQIIMSEAEYEQARLQTGMEIPARPFEAIKRSVKWCKMTGKEVLEETEFPSMYLPLVPVLGYELWIDGERYLCGMTRRLMDSQRAYNYERSAFVESVAMQPKAPFLTPVEAMDGLESHWKALNSGNPAVLPYNHLDESGNPIPAPTRMAPPAFPVAFAQGGQIASTDMESAVGMFRANLGAPGAATSGRAKREDKVAGDTANFHYIDNLSRSIEQVGRVIVDMIPRIYNTQRQARIMGETGDSDFVGINPDQPNAVEKKGKKVISINPGVGAYDVRVKTGPAYTTLREEAAEQLAMMMQSAPSLMPILGDLWIGMQDWPEAEVARKRLEMMLPPQIQQAEQDDGEPIPVHIQQAMTQATQMIEQLKAALQEAQSGMPEAQLKAQVEIQKAQLQAQADSQKAQLDAQVRMALAEKNADASYDVAELKGLIEMLKVSLQPPPQLAQAVSEDMAEDS